MTKLTDDRLRELVDGPIGGIEMKLMARELLLLRAECQAWREQERLRLAGTEADYYKAADAVQAARKATDEGDYQP